MWYRKAQFFSSGTPAQQGDANVVPQQQGANPAMQQPPVPPGWKGWTPPSQRGQQGQPQQGQGQPQQGQGQQGQSIYQQMSQAMREGRMPVKSADGSIGYLEKGLWSIQKPPGFGSAQYPVMFADGTSKTPWILPDHLRQGAQFSSPDFNTANQFVQENIGADSNKALVKIDSGTFVYIPASYCTQTNPPVGANWSQYKTVDGRLIYGANPEMQTARVQQLAEAKANPQQQKQPDDYLTQQMKAMQSALQGQNEFAAQYEQMLNGTNPEEQGMQSNFTPTMGRKRRRLPGGRSLPPSG